ncbi:Hypothetical protein A7982_01039 [Minicystis rosea]|nr:Hypothetical protein A7982_01039 [Minicystis rosea]
MLTVSAKEVSAESVRVTVDEGTAIALYGTTAVRGSDVSSTGGGVIAHASDATAGAVTLAGIRVTQASAPIGVDVEGRSIEVSGIDVESMAPQPASSVVGVLLTGTDVAARNVTVREMSGARAIGLEATGDVVRLAMVSTNLVTSTSSGAAPDGAQAIGVSVEAKRVELNSVHANHISGANVVGIRALSGTLSTAELVAVGVHAEDVTATTEAIGLLLGSAAGFDMRGFVVNNVRGARAAGVLLVSGQAPAVNVGRVTRIAGSSGASAGARVLGLPSSTDTLVRDVRVESVGLRIQGDSGSVGSTLAMPSGAPPAAWSTWARSMRNNLATAAPADGVRWRAGVLFGPARPSDTDVAGLHVGLAVSDIDALGGSGPLSIEGASLRRIAGVALQIDGGLRVARLRRLDVYLARHAGLVQAEALVAAELTIHLLGRGLRFGPGEVRLYDAILTDIGSDALKVDAGADLAAIEGVYTNLSPLPDARVTTLPGSGYPYVDRGATSLPTALDKGEAPTGDSVDLHLLPTVKLVSVAIPGDASRPFVGAYDPGLGAPICDLIDPEPRPRATASGPTAPSPAVSYLARDAAGLLEVMLGRADVVMPSWTERGAADLTTMLVELLAERLDHLAYAQERAVTEGFLQEATLRRSVADHARALDCEPDPGLCATAMIRFRSDGDEAVEISAGTLITSAQGDEAAVIFATESSLALAPSLDILTLTEDCETGATSARVALVADEQDEDEIARSLARLVPGRWLVLYQGAHAPGHVVRVTSIEVGADTTALVRWDPRRPAPSRFPRGAEVYGNVVPAHHGVPLAAMGAGEVDALFGKYRAELTIDVDGEDGPEVELPLGPVSVQARGYPVPGDEARAGVPSIQVAVDGVAWTRVESLAQQGPSDEVFVLREGEGGRSWLRFGDGVHGSALPARQVRLTIDLTVGLGRAGNVGASRLTRLLRTPPAPGITCDNPLPAVGGRDPESLDRLRYRVPKVAAQPESAITQEDYEAILGRMPAVAAARAHVIEEGVQPLVRMTVLLRDEDTIADAERLRRWAEVRRRLEQVRLLGFDVEAVPPAWVPLDLDIAVDADPHAHASDLHDLVVEAIAGQGGMLDPDRSGLGGDVHLSALHQTVLAVPGVRGLRVKRFRRMEASAREWLPEGFIPIGPDEVAVIRGPQRAGKDGVLTVTVCGGLR